MITILLAMLSAIFGGLVGAFAGFFIVYGLGLLVGADTQQGALAMGAAVTGLPVGGIIGALGSAILVVVVRKRRGASEEIGRFGWIAIGIVAVAVAGFAYWFFDDGLPPEYGRGKSPYLLVEIRIPSNDPDLDEAATKDTYLGNEEVFYSPEGPLERLEDGDYTILKAKHLIGFKTEDRHVYIWLGHNRKLIFELDLPRKPQPTEFSDWQPVTRVEPGFYGNTFIPDGGHDYHIRVKVEGP